MNNNSSNTNNDEIKISNTIEIPASIHINITDDDVRKTFKELIAIDSIDSKSKYVQIENIPSIDSSQVLEISNGISSTSVKEDRSSYYGNLSDESSVESMNTNMNEILHEIFLTIPNEFRQIILDENKNKLPDNGLDYQGMIKLAIMKLYDEILMLRNDTKELNSYKTYYEIVTSLPDCNTCDNKSCQYKPLLGQNVRINCMFHIPRSEENG